MNELTCSFCFNLINFHDSIMANCNTCTVKYHRKCLEELNDNGWICPICRKIDSKAYQYNNNYIDFFFNLFMANPNFCTFIMFYVTSIILVFVWIIPYIVYTVLVDYVKRRINNIRHNLIIFNMLFDM